MDRRYLSMRNNAQGKLFEQSIEAGCGYYRDNGQAVVYKTPETFRVLKLEGQGIFKGRFIGKAQPDFCGTLKSGRSIIFEAKHTAQDKIAKGILTDTQTKMLQEHYELGAVVAVCVSLLDICYFIPWHFWIETGRKSLKADDLKEFRVKYDGAVRFLDYEMENLVY